MSESPFLSSEIKSVDHEHQVQIRLMKLLKRTLENGDDEHEVSDQLAEYTRAHFMSEELLMRQYEYPDFDDHVQDHERLLDWFDEISNRQADRASKLRALQEMTAIFLRHIGSRDERLHEFLGSL